MDFEDLCLSNLVYLQKKFLLPKRWLTIPKSPASLNDLIFDNDLFKNTLIDCE